MPTHILFVSLVVVAALAGAPRAAQAAPAKPWIVIESHAGQRPADADTWLVPVQAELTKRGFLAGAPLADEIRRTMSRDAGPLTATQSVAAQNLVTQSYQFFIDGDYAAAADRAEKALALYAPASAQLTRETALRDLQFKALLIAARSHEVLRHGEEAFGFMAEAIRSFPDRHVSAAEFDPRVNALYRRVKAELAAQGTGGLEIKVDDASAAIFLDERYVGTGTATIDALFPGAYRVFVAKGEQAPGRVHEVRVAPTETTTLSIAWELDAALRSGAQHVALELPAGATVESEVAMATRVGRALGARRVVLLSVRSIDGRRCVTGHAILTDSQSRTFAAVQLEPIEPAAGTLVNLGAFLAGDRSVDTSDLVTGNSIADAHLDDGPRWYSDRWGWALTGAGAVVTGVGVGLIVSGRDLQDRANAEDRQAERRDLRDRASTRLWLGSAAAVVGVAALGAGITKLVLRGDDDSAEREPGARIAVGLGWLGVEGRF